MNAVIFARGKNIEAQVKECREYAERQGYTVNGVIVGGSHEITGTIKSLQSDIKIDRVIIRDMSRLSRNALTNYTIQAELEIDCGVLVEAANSAQREAIEQRLMLNIIKAVQEEQNRTRQRAEMKLKLYE